MKKITLFLTMLLLVCVSTAVAQENGKMYKLKVAGTSKYLTAFNNSRHQTGSVGGVGVSASTTNENAQIFTFASATDSQGKSGFTLKSEEGRFIKCWKWNIDAINDTDFSVLIFESAGNNQFRIKWFNNENDGWSAHDAEKYIKVQDVSGTEYVFGDASSNDAAQWELEEVQTNVVKSVADLSNNKAYTVTLPGFSKKGWAVNSANLGAITDLSLSEDASDVNQRFAFLTPDNGETYYLYSVGQSKFVNYSGDEAVLSDKPQHSVSFETGNKENTFVVYFDKSHFINVPSERGMIIDGWGPGGTKGSADNGNSVRITAVADFDPTDALSNFGVSPEDFAGYMMLASKYLDRSSLGVVGYPIAEQTVFNNLRTAWATIMGKGYDEGTFDYNATDCNALIDAYNAYINSTDVKMPEDGKAYVIRNVHQNGNQYKIGRAHV